MPELLGKIAIWAWVVCVLWATAPRGGWRAWGLGIGAAFGSVAERPP